MIKNIKLKHALAIIIVTAVVVISLGAAIIVGRLRNTGPYDEKVFQRVVEYCNMDVAEVTRGRDKWRVENMVTPYFSSAPDAPMLTLYKINKGRASCNDDDIIIISFNEDKNFVTAEVINEQVEAEGMRMPQDYINKYKAESGKNVASGGILAWEYDGYANVVFDYKKGKLEPDSIWAVNKSTKNVSLVWCNEEYNTYWKEYSSSK